MENPLKLMLVNFIGDQFLTDVVKLIQCKNKFVVIAASVVPENCLQLDVNVELINLNFLQREETVDRAFPKYTPVVLDGDTLKAFYECKSFFMRTLDRVFIAPKSVRSHESYFYKLLAYTLSYFSQNKCIKGVVFDSVPHFPWDLTIFFVARHMGIETRIFRRTLLDDKVVLDTDFRAKYGKFVQFSPNEEFLDNSHNAKKDDEPFWLRHAKTINKKTRNSFFSSISMEFLISFPWLIKFFLESFRSYRNGYMGLSPPKFFFRLIQQKIKVLYLKRWLISNSDSVNLSDPFVYFALHYQPEKSTDPEAEEFTHQYIAIRLLADTLPDGWKIYVKEHPRQVSSHPDIRMAHYRSVRDYCKIKSIPHVCLLHPSCDSEELINNCRMTASCTGSSVWEGMLKGKPGITFGRVWHSQCRSSLIVNSVLDAKNAFHTLSKKTELEVLNDVEIFLSDFSRCMIVSTNCGIAANASSIPRNVLVSNLAEAIIKSLP